MFESISVREHKNLVIFETMKHEHDPGGKDSPYSRFTNTVTM